MRELTFILHNLLQRSEAKKGAKRIFIDDHQIPTSLELRPGPFTSALSLHLPAIPWLNGPYDVLDASPTGIEVPKEVVSNGLELENTPLFHCSSSPTRGPSY